MVVFKKKIDFDIDLVYLWCDGSEPEFVREREYWEQKLNIKENEHHNSHKFVDNEELRYSLRSVEKNAPWINKIYIVTNGQVPKWLDITKSNKIKIVEHKEIIPPDALPTFNSNAIEACIANIPDLSEHFLLANDDCFINRPVKPNFFFDKNGKPKVRMLNQFVSKKVLKEYLYHRCVRRSLNIINKKYRKHYNFTPQHNIDAYTKTYYKECIKEFPQEFNNVIYQKFRGKSIQRNLISLYMLANKHCKLIKISSKNKFGHKESLYTRISSGAKMLELLNKTTPQLLCINDYLGVKQEYYVKYKSFLEFLYPDKSPYENDLQNTGVYDNVIDSLREKQKTYNNKWRIVNYILDIIKPVFSTKKEQEYRVYTLFGLIKINVATKNNIKNINNNYKNVLIRLKKKLVNNEKIRVIFMVTENSKWAYQSVYDEFLKSKEFEPLILVSVLNVVKSGKDTTRESAESNYKFFKSRGLNVEYMYKDGEYIDLKSFKPDIVFYEQPWKLDKEYTPKVVSKYALCCYVSYSYMVIKYLHAYNQTFHKHLFKFFVESELLINDYEKFKKGNKKNCVVTGYPKLDVYTDKIISNADEYWKNSDKFKIIYAPHHSVDNLLQCATFRENGRFILEWAKNHPETTFIFKPHPRLKFALQNCHFMNEEEIESYYAEWANVGKVYTQGDYFDIFKTSDLMLTDCVSFLAEYLPSKKPLIRMVNKDGIELNSLGEKIVSEYYCSHNNQELENLLTEIVLNKNDYKNENRLKLANQIFDFNEKASSKIYKYLLEEINEN